ncbi:MAG: esterase family protein [Muribaculaceae bacterium]|nr:esterase family protein [Muribaculaceae bacterium]
MTRRLSFLIISTLCAFFSMMAQRVDTLHVFSPSMQKNIPNLVILPEGYDHTQRYPVIYLLHGHGGNYNSWLRQVKPELPHIASHHKIIMVCPDGATSWYWDSPVDPSIRYETYVARELTGAIDSLYSTVTSPAGRAITGFSMGGHGALWLGLRHQDTFGACGATSGGVDIRPFPDSWNMKRSLGEYHEHPEVWDSHTVINQLHLYRPGLAVIVDCGTEDFFYRVNERLHAEMLYRNIPHEYITRPGAHNSEYWSNSIDNQITFFTKFFNRQK